MDGISEDLRESRVQRIDVGDLQALGGELRAPGADMRRHHLRRDLIEEILMDKKPWLKDPDERWHTKIQTDDDTGMDK